MKFGTALEFFDMALDSTALLTFLPRLYNTFFKKEKASDQEKVKSLLEEGKQTEALEEVISSWSTGLSDKDEMRLLRDVCYLITGSKITPEEGYAFYSFLENTNVALRKRFREAYITDKDPIMRWGVIIVLAKLPDDDQRMAFLVGGGLTDPTLMEEFMAAAGTSFTQLGNYARAKIPELKRRQFDREITADPCEKKGGWGNAFEAMFKFKLF
jgi:hypothetical protein